MSTTDKSLYTDIQSVLDGLARLTALRETADDRFSGQAGNFIDDNAQVITALLQELAALRARMSGDGSPDYVGTHRFMVEGTSDENPEEALAHALSNAAHFFSEHHDVLLTLAQLGPRPEGGFRAVVDVHITMFKPGLYAHQKSADVVRARERESEFRTDRKAERERVGHMVFDHFMHVKSAAPGNMPASFLVNINDAFLLNNLIEKQFFKSAHPDLLKLSASGLSLDEPVTMVVRAHPPEREPE